MDPAIYVQLLTSDPVGSLKSGLRFVHFVGLACGLGAATLLDLFLLKFFVRRSITREGWEIFHFSTRIVNVGLIVLWASGIGFLIHYALFDPMKLSNEKIWAKLCIVWILTANGMFLHAVVMPRMRNQVGRGLFEGMSAHARSMFMISGAVSAVSWYVPVVLGTFPHLNFSISAGAILVTYAGILAVVALGMLAVTSIIFRPRGAKSLGPAIPA